MYFEIQPLFLDRLKIKKLIFLFISKFMLSILVSAVPVARQHFFSPFFYISTLEVQISAQRIHGKLQSILLLKGAMGTVNFWPVSIYQENKATRGGCHFSKICLITWLISAITSAKNSLKCLPKNV